MGLARIPVAWAIAKGTLPIIGVREASRVEDAVKAADRMGTISGSKVDKSEMITWTMENHLYTGAVRVPDL